MDAKIEIDSVKRTQLAIIIFYENIYNLSREKPISQKEYTKEYDSLYEDLVQNDGDLSIFKEVPTDIYNCLVPWGERPLLNLVSKRFERNWSKKQEDHFMRTINGKPSRNFIGLIVAEVATSITYGTLPIAPGALLDLGLTGTVFHAANFVWHAVGVSSVAFSVIASKYVPKSFAMNIDIKHDEIIRDMNNLYEDFLLEPERRLKETGEKITYKELFAKRGGEFAQLRKRLNDAIDAVQAETLDELEKFPGNIEFNAKYVKIMRRRGDMDMYKKAIAELDERYTYEKNIFKKIKLAWEAKSIKVFKPFDISKRPIMAQAIRRVHRQMGKSYNDLLKAFNIGENKSLKTLMGFDIATTLMYVAEQFLPIVKKLPELAQTVLRGGAISSFPITYVMLGFVGYTIANQMNFMHIPNRAYVPKEKSFLGDNPVKREKFRELDRSERTPVKKVIKHLHRDGGRAPEIKKTKN